MHEPTATIENGALFSGTRVILPRSVSPGLKQSGPTSGSVARKKANEAGRRGEGEYDGIYASANFI